MERNIRYHIWSYFFGFPARFRGFLRIFQRSTSLPRSGLRRARRASIATNRIRLKPKSKPANIEHWRYGTKPLVSRCQVRSALDYLAIGTHHPFQSLSMSSKNIKEEDVWNTSGSDQTNPAFNSYVFLSNASNPATSMLRCVLGILGYLRPSGVSGATKFQLVHGIEANDLQQGWDWGFGDGPKNLRYFIFPNGVDTGLSGGWNILKEFQKKTSPSFIDSNSRNCCARMGKIKPIGA